jgi:hypothetical protein
MLWIVFVNNKRNIVAHPSAGVSIPPEDLTQLEEYRDWLVQKIKTPAKNQVEEPSK